MIGKSRGGTFLALGMLCVGGAGAACRRPSPTGLAPALEGCKAATVLIQAGDAFGSGFVVADVDSHQFIVTNEHVVADLAPGRQASVTYRPGTPTEWTGTATLVAASASEDLALLKTTGPRDPPQPLDGPGDDPAELTPVVALGFPFGPALTLNGKRPAATLSRAAISAQRRGVLGGLELLQLDNNLNPGNSGGPVVDADGRVVGLSVAAVPGAGIGFIIPWARVQALMNGHVATTRVRPIEPCFGTAPCQLRVEVEPLDPFGKVDQVEVRSIVADDAFLSRERRGTLTAEGSTLASGTRPASGSMVLTTTATVAPGQRVFLQLGFGTGQLTTWTLPFEATPAKAAVAPRPPPPPVPAPPPEPPKAIVTEIPVTPVPEVLPPAPAPRAAPPPPDEPTTGWKGPCRALAGKWTRTDGFVFDFSVKGCAITGRGDNPDFRHVLEGTWSPTSRRMLVAIGRDQAAGGCHATMYAQVSLDDARRMRLLIYGTDGRCGLSAGLHDAQVYFR